MATSKIQTWLDFTSNALTFDAKKSIAYWLSLEPALDDWMSFHDTVIGKTPVSHITDQLYAAIPPALPEQMWPTYINSMTATHPAGAALTYFFVTPREYGTSVLKALVDNLSHTDIQTSIRRPRSLATKCGTTLLQNPPSAWFKEDGHPEFAVYLHRLSIWAHLHSTLKLGSLHSLQWSPSAIYDDYGLCADADKSASQALALCTEYMVYHHELDLCGSPSEKTLLRYETQSVLAKMNISLEIFEALMDFNRPDRHHNVSSIMATACMYITPETPTLVLPDLTEELIP